MTAFPVARPRRLREKEKMRLLVRETELSPQDLIYPAFVTHGRGIEEEIAAMPGNFHYSLDRLLSHIEEWQELGLP
ncbi:MAG: porphobilinogen synthase, partial [Firmicutes bacterium]|nr:porphobilinogen synthase [Bacillota bacterium]